MTRDDIAAVIKKVPNLTSFGLGTFSGVAGVTPAEREKDFKKEQATLLDASEHCTAICRWLEPVGKAKTINTKRNSYGLKHDVEKVLGEHVSNGEFICAAIHMGFKFRAFGPNACFDMAQKDIERVVAGELVSR